MKILIVTGVFAPDIGGPASYARALAARLVARGHQPVVLAYSSVRAHKADTALGYPIRRVWTRIPWGLRHSIFFIRAFLLARRADGILALNAVSAGIPASWASRLLGKPLVVRVVGDYAWEMAVQTGRTFLMIDEFQKAPKSGRPARLHGLQVRTCRAAAAVIVPSEYLAGLVSGWGVDAERIHIIYNGVEAVTQPASKEEARKELGISGNLIVTAGRLVPWKGFRMLIKIMPSLLQVNQFFRLVIVGDGPDLKMLQTVVRTLGLERKVLLAGRQPAAMMASYLAAADLFVLNTGYEGFSHQVLEAMAAGVPVITTSSGGNREVIAQGQNGFMVHYNDEFNLTEAIKAVWKNAALRERMAANGRITAGSFSVEKMYERTEQLLTDTLKP
jgi:glycosyltransferase involved in cell wall biosynthesis